MKTKVTKKNTLEFVRLMLRRDKKWATKALVRIFKENQTEAEKSMERTVEDNGIGFGSRDAKFLSSLAKQFIETGTLSEKQMGFVFRLIPKYARQVVEFSDPARLYLLVHDHLCTVECETEEARRNEERSFGRN